MNEIKGENNLTAAECCHKIMKTGGLFFGVSFVKKNGNVRKMTCRKGVYHPLCGGQNTVTHIPRYVTVWDVFAKGYRNVNLNTIFSLRCGGQEFQVV